MWLGSSVVVLLLYFEATGAYQYGSVRPNFSYGDQYNPSYDYYDVAPRLGPENDNCLCFNATLQKYGIQFPQFLNAIKLMKQPLDNKIWQFITDIPEIPSQTGYTVQQKPIYRLFYNNIDISQVYPELLSSITSFKSPEEYEQFLNKKNQEINFEAKFPGLSQLLLKFFRETFGKPSTNGKPMSYSISLKSDKWIILADGKDISNELFPIDFTKQKFGSPEEYLSILNKSGFNEKYPGIVEALHAAYKSFLSMPKYPDSAIVNEKRPPASVGDNVVSDITELDVPFTKFDNTENYYKFLVDKEIKLGLEAKHPGLTQILLKLFKYNPKLSTIDWSGIQRTHNLLSQGFRRVLEVLPQLNVPLTSFKSPNEYLAFLNSKNKDNNLTIKYPGLIEALYEYFLTNPVNYDQPILKQGGVLNGIGNIMSFVKNGISSFIPQFTLQDNTHGSQINIKGPLGGVFNGNIQSNGIGISTHHDPISIGINTNVVPNKIGITSNVQGHNILDHNTNFNIRDPVSVGINTNVVPNKIGITSNVQGHNVFDHNTNSNIRDPVSIGINTNAVPNKIGITSNGHSHNSNHNTHFNIRDPSSVGINTNIVPNKMDITSNVQPHHTLDFNTNFNLKLFGANLVKNKPDFSEISSSASLNIKLPEDLSIPFIYFKTPEEYSAYLQSKTKNLRNEPLLPSIINKMTNQFQDYYQRVKGVLPKLTDLIHQVPDKNIEIDIPGLFVPFSNFPTASLYFEFLKGKDSVYNIEARFPGLINILYNQYLQDPKKTTFDMSYSLKDLLSSLASINSDIIAPFHKFKNVDEYRTFLESNNLKQTNPGAFNLLIEAFINFKELGLNPFTYYNEDFLLSLDAQIPGIARPFYTFNSVYEYSVFLNLLDSKYSFSLKYPSLKEYLLESYKLNPTGRVHFNPSTFMALYKENPGKWSGMFGNFFNVVSSGVLNVMQDFGQSALDVGHIIAEGSSNIGQTLTNLAATEVKRAGSVFSGLFPLHPFRRTLYSSSAASTDHSKRNFKRTYANKWQHHANSQHGDYVNHYSRQENPHNRAHYYIHY